MQELTTSFLADINILVFCKHLVLGTIYAFILSVVAKKFSKVVGNKTQYIVLFPLLIPTMILIISVIKTSLALSLGLVGALSIVRFRTAIKEPEELSYLFIAIAVGLGLGAEQVVPTTICFFFVIAILIILGLFRKVGEPQGIFLDIDTIDGSEPLDLKQYSAILKESKIPFELRRYEEDNESLSATYYLEPDTLNTLEGILEEFRKLTNKARYTVISKVNLLS